MQHNPNVDELRPVPPWLHYLETGEKTYNFDKAQNMLTDSEQQLHNEQSDPTGRRQNDPGKYSSQ